MARTEQACAFGAAMFAAVIAGVHRDIPAAQKAMGQGFSHEYIPNAENHKLYATQYERYKKLGTFTETELFS